MREWLVDLVGEGMAPVASFVLAAAIVVILVFVVIWVAKRALGGQIGSRAKGRGPRLAVMDVTPIDPKRKLVLVRRDEVEHLILIGGQNDVVIEANILRVAAGNRTSRTEPTFRPEEPPAVDRRPAAPTAAPQRLASPVPAAPQPQRKPASGPVRTGAPATTSPLARAVPRTPAAEESSPAAADVSNDQPVLRAEPLVSMPVPMAPAPEAPAATAPATAAERREPSFSGMPTAPLATVTPVTDRPETLPKSESTPFIADASAPPIVVAPRLDDPSLTQAEASPQVALPRRAAESAPTPADQVRSPVPAQEDRSTGRPVAPQRPASSSSPSVEATRASGQQAIVRTPVPTSPAASPQNGGPRVAITGNSEPVRRPAPLVSAPTRAMVTPTYSGLSSQMFRQDATAPSEPAPPVVAPEPVADRGMPPAENSRAQTETADIRGDRGRHDAPTMREISPRAGEPSSAVIAAAERQRELIRARPTPTMTPKAPVEAAAPKVDGNERAETQHPEPSSAEGASGERTSPAAEAPQEKKPLEVRSFAAAIQAGRAMPVSAPPSPAAAPRPPEPVRAAPLVPMAVPEPDKAPEATDDAFAGLDDFLSAELDFGLDDVHWNDEPASPAPEVRLDAPKPAEPVAEKQPRALSLEEEMERLLGDFNFETSDENRR